MSILMPSCPRTIRIKDRFSKTWRQPTHVRCGSCFRRRDLLGDIHRPLHCLPDFDSVLKILFAPVTLIALSTPAHDIFIQVRIIFYDP